MNWIKNPGKSANPPTAHNVHIKLRGNKIEEGELIKYNQNPFRWDWLSQGGVEIVEYAIADIQ